MTVESGPIYIPLLHQVVAFHAGWFFEHVPTATLEQVREISKEAFLNLERTITETDVMPSELLDGFNEYMVISNTSKIAFDALKAFCEVTEIVKQELSHYDIDELSEQEMEAVAEKIINAAYVAFYSLMIAFKSINDFRCTHISPSHMINVLVDDRFHCTHLAMIVASAAIIEISCLFKSRGF